MSERVWSVPVRIEDLPDEGGRFELDADDAVRAELARRAGVAGLTRLHACFEVTRRGPGARVAGTVTGRVLQSCVVTLEPLENVVEEAVDLVFLPVQDHAFGGAAESPGGAEPPEILRDGTVDLAAIAAEFLILGIDPYPRKPGAVFAQQSEAVERTGPFAALGALMIGRRGPKG